jgi:hypothetical protein
MIATLYKLIGDLRHDALVCKEDAAKIQTTTIPSTISHYSELDNQQATLCQSLDEELKRLKVYVAEVHFQLPPTFDSTLPPECVAILETGKVAHDDWLDKLLSPSNNIPDSELEEHINSFNLVGCDNEGCLRIIKLKKSITANKAAAAAAHVLTRAKSGYVNAVSMKFPILIDQFIRYLVSGITVAIGVLWNNGDSAMFWRFRCGKMDFICNFVVVEEKQHCNVENLKASGKLSTLERVICAAIDDSFFLFRHYPAFCEEACPEMLKKGNTQVMSALQMIKNKLSEFFELIKDWIGKWIDAWKASLVSKFAASQAALSGLPSDVKGSFEFYLRRMVDFKMDAFHEAQAVSNICQLRLRQLQSETNDYKVIDPVKTKCNFEKGEEENAQADLENAEHELASYINKPPVEMDVASKPEKEKIKVEPKVYTVGYNHEMHVCDIETAQSLNAGDCNKLKGYIKRDAVFKAVEFEADFFSVKALEYLDNMKVVASGAATNAGRNPLIWLFDKPPPPIVWKTAD